jgi:acyl-CoA dehydrogenase
LWFSFTGAYLQKTPFNDQTARYYQLLNRFSANLAMLSDISMVTLGGELKRKERISARLGDVLSYLYLASATLKRYNDEGRKIEDLPLVQWAVEDSLFKIQEAINDLITNFPSRSARVFLRCTIFPLGSWLQKPSDITDQKVAEILQTPSETRNRIGKWQYLKRDPSHPMGQLEQTLEDIIACEPIYTKACKALDKYLPFYKLNLVAEEAHAAGVITQEEADLLCKAEIGRKAAIDVDDFSSKELQANSVMG